LAITLSYHPGFRNAPRSLGKELSKRVRPEEFCYDVERDSTRHAEGRFLGHQSAVFISQMSVGFGNEHTAVRMPKPTGNGVKIDPSLDGVGAEKMAAI
jgi:hypothetical protein